MKLALNTGEIEVRHHFDRLFFCYRDLIENMGFKYSPSIMSRRRGLTTQVYFPRNDLKANQPKLYIAEEEVMHFLDSFHRETKETTMLLMFDLTQRLEELHELIDS